MAYQLVYVGKGGKASLVLEGVANHNLFWQAAFGLPGMHNDTNILDQSPLCYTVHSTMTLTSISKSMVNVL
jgi:Plant transposon protein